MNLQTFLAESCPHHPTGQLFQHRHLHHLDHLLHPLHHQLLDVDHWEWKTPKIVYSVQQLLQREKSKITWNPAFFHLRTPLIHLHLQLLLRGDVSWPIFYWQSTWCSFSKHNFLCQMHTNADTKTSLEQQKHPLKYYFCRRNIFFFFFLLLFYLYPLKHFCSTLQMFSLPASTFFLFYSSLSILRSFNWLTLTVIWPLNRGQMHCLYTWLSLLTQQLSPLFGLRLQ